MIGGFGSGLGGFPGLNTIGLYAIGLKPGLGPKPGLGLASALVMARPRAAIAVKRWSISRICTKPAV